MLYQRADTSHFYNGGYDWIAPGMTFHELSSDVYPHFYLHVYFNLITCTASTTTNFYLPEIGGCWKADGVSPCDGDHSTDITRYANFIVNPNFSGTSLQRCVASSPASCPPYHKFKNGTRVASTDKLHFPYSCYHGQPPTSHAPQITSSLFSALTFPPSTCMCWSLLQATVPLRGPVNLGPVTRSPIPHPRS
jgi:hypothetical protein